MWADDQLRERTVDLVDLADFADTALKHPDARGLYEMWNALRGDRSAPFRAELDASRIGARAPFLAILEYVGPCNFRIRIAGDRLNKWFGLELRGMSALSILTGDARNPFQGALNRLTAEPAAVAAHGAARRSDGFTAAFELVLLPMRSDFGRVDRVLVGMWLLDAPALTKGPMRLDPDSFEIAPIFGEGDGYRAEPVEDAPVMTVITAPKAADDGDPPAMPPSRDPEPTAPQPVAEAEEAPAQDPSAPQAPEGGPLRAIEGGGQGASRGKRGHLKLVKS